MEPKRKSLLRELRTKAGISQTELARLTGCYKSNISSMEYGKISICELNARRFGDIFKIDWHVFICKK